MHTEGDKYPSKAPSPPSQQTDGRDAIHWSPRVTKWRLRRLYETEARGIYDDELIDEVGMTLYARCRDILTIWKAQDQRLVLCPRCDRARQEVLISRHGELDERLVCPACGWAITWRDYQKTYKRRQLNPGGAVPAFEEYLQAYERATSPRERMLAIDQVIHAFHYSLRADPDQPTRPAGVNLIDGTMTDIVPFLDALSGVSPTPERRAIYREYEETYRRMAQLYQKGETGD